VGNKLVYVAELMLKVPTDTPTYATISLTSGVISWTENFNDALQFSTREECVEWITQNKMTKICQVCDHMYT